MVKKALVIILFCLVVALPVLWLNGFIARPAIFFFSQVDTYEFSDSGDVFIVSSKVAYPKSELIDPAGVVRIDRVSKEDGKLLDRFDFYLHEVDDVESLEIELNEDHVPQLKVGYGWPDGADGLLLLGEADVSN